MCPDYLPATSRFFSVTDELWDTYERGKLQAGWSYPVGRTIVEASLRAVGVHLLSLDFAMLGGTTTDPILLQATRYLDLGNTYSYFRPRGTPERSRSVLRLYAVPSAARAEARAALTTGCGLDRACRWLAAAENADPTWRYKSHSWTADLFNGALRVAEEPND
jgi:hypothetical protein